MTQAEKEKKIQRLKELIQDRNDLIEETNDLINEKYEALGKEESEGERAWLEWDIECLKGELADLRSFRNRYLEMLKKLENA